MDTTVTQDYQLAARGGKAPVIQLFHITGQPLPSPQMLNNKIFIKGPDEGLILGPSEFKHVFTGWYIKFDEPDLHAQLHPPNHFKFMNVTYEGDMLLSGNQICYHIHNLTTETQVLKGYHGILTFNY